MKTFKISSLFKFIYLAIIILFFLKFFSLKETLQYNLDGLTIVEISSMEKPLLPKKIKTLELSYKGVVFYISKKSPIHIISDDNIKRDSNIKKLNILQNSLQLILENNVILNFRVDNSGERLTISSNIPKVFPTIKELTIPYSISSGYNLEQTELSYKISNEKNEFHLKLNDKYTINEDRIVLQAEDDKISTLTFSPLSNSELPIVEQWYLRFREPQLVPLETVKDDFLKNIEREMRGKFNNIRYDSVNKTWQNLPSLANFTENAVIVYLANAMENGTYSKSLQKILGIKNRYPNIFGFESMPYLGNMITNGRVGLSKDKKRLREIQTQIGTSDIKLFTERIPKHYFDGNQINTTLLEIIINKQDKNELTLQELSVSLDHLIKILETGTTNSESSNSIKEITDLIIQKIKWDETGLYLVDNSIMSSQMLNLIIGQLLIDASQHETSEYSKPIGEALIYTFINNSDSKGAVNSSYNIENSSLSVNSINPEDIYLMLTDNRYIPHYYQDQGIKVWTISDSIVINKSYKDIRITITYPVDYSTKVNSHFLTISNIKPYTQLFFKDGPWRADIKFERYGVGYFYEKSTQQLYFMPNHNKPREEILINY